MDHGLFWTDGPAPEDKGEAVHEDKFDETEIERFTVLAQFSQAHKL